MVGLSIANTSGARALNDISDRLTAMVLPDSLTDFAAPRQILTGRHGTILHKTVHSDLRFVTFLSSMPFLCFLIRGTERFSQTGRPDVVMGPQELIVLPQGRILHSDFVSKEGPLEAVLIFLSNTVIDNFLTRHNAPPAAEEATSGLYRIPARHRMSTFMHSVVDIYENLAVDEDLVRAKLVELLHLLAALADHGPLVAALRDGRGDGPAINLHQIMRQAGSGTLTMPELAALAGRSPASFNRDIKRVFGTSPAKWLLEQRMARARSLLIQGRKSVTEIAMEVGYDSISHFIEQFRRHFDETPSQLRKRARDQTSGTDGRP
ncbi:AraC family transcriptional regulator [Actibacterium sp. 188UL27-1]|uniref:helix-turn-helix domain-containing protein n=1 Tax=Actibacterium sp. 188UL27-1 TaxID=2786961 RepID=UPI00195CF24F|nr:AraC family transcriptional regulator [Actibacterium sp. 188UL27-1]MBM7069168.1 helix-turn-helix transcriptional regulator [Actibacterium sp. 188UL27-1]